MAKFKTLRQREAELDARLDGIGICHLDLGGDSAPAPDPMIGQAAAANAKNSADYLDWYKAKDAADKPARDEAIALSLSAARSQAATAKKQEGYADDTKAYELSTYRPLEQKIASNALGYDTPARRDAESAQAQSDAGSAIDAQRVNAGREIESRGGDVNSGNYLAALSRGAVVGGAAQGAAGNQARKNVEAVGSAKLADAANLGRGIASTNATQTQLGLQAGNSGVANAQVPGNISNAQTAAYGNVVGTANAGNSSAGNLMLGQYNAQTNAQQAANSSGNALMGAVGTVAGAYFGGPAGAAVGAKMLSDENMKKDRKPVSGKLSLAALRKVPVEQWKYKGGSPGDDGGKTHVGPMAQAYNKALGNATAPNGTKVDLISLSGHQTGAIQELAKRVIRLEDAISRGPKKKA